jgi:hypothetical protein
MWITIRTSFWIRIPFPYLSLSNWFSPHLRCVVYNSPHTMIHRVFVKFLRPFEYSTNIGVKKIIIHDVRQRIKELNGKFISATRAELSYVFIEIEIDVMYLHIYPAVPHITEGGDGSSVVNIEKHCIRRCAYTALTNLLAQFMFIIRGM